MSNIFSPVDVIQFFSKNNNIYTNLHGITFEMVNHEFIRVSTTVNLTSYQGFKVPMRILVPHYGLYPFVNAYPIPSLHFMKRKLSLAHLYEQYYEEGRGQVICSLTEFLGSPQKQPIDLIFEHLPANGGTKVSAPCLYFCEELKEGFYDEEQYFEYIFENRHLFVRLAQNRHLLEIAKSLGKENTNN